MNNKFNWLFVLQEKYGDDFQILKTTIDKYPTYKNGEKTDISIPIVYFDLKIYGEYIFVGVHQNSEEQDYIMHKGKNILIDYHNIPSYLFKAIPLLDDGV